MFRFVGIFAFCCFLIICHVAVYRIYMKREHQTRNEKYLSRGIEHFPPLNQSKMTGIFCFVETSQKYHETRVPPVWSSWLNKCDHGRIFTSTQIQNRQNISHSTVYRNLNDGYFQLFYKTIWSFYFAYKDISNQFDWYLKADDDTLVIMNNLRKYLATLDPKRAHYLGVTMKYSYDFYQAGAIYILSNEAVRRFVEKAYGDVEKCPYFYDEDAGLGRCLYSIGIISEDTRDENGRNRFVAFSPKEIFNEEVPSEWFLNKNTLKKDIHSNDLISVHHLTPDEFPFYSKLFDSYFGK